jgi:RHS repeat-associated protein
MVTAGGNTFCYDRNGNMVKRNGTSYTLTYDAENRLTGVSGGTSASLVYDGDGKRVKATFGSSTTAYVGDYFDWTGSTSTMVRYYSAGGQRVAMRVGSSTVYYLVTDHLGSTAITANNSGTRTAELRYKAWGETRYTYGTTPTAYKFTGQRLDDSTGLYYYGARYYDAALGRFVQADTVVPEPGNPQALNRYSYVANNPLRYTDPSGHCLNEDGETVCDFRAMHWVQIMSHPLYQEASLALANMIYGEQRGESTAFQAAAGHVAWNRAEHRLENVIPKLSEPNQFQGYQGPHVPVPEPKGINLERWETIQDEIVPDILVWNEDPDPTRGARYFANIPLDEEATYADTLARKVQKRFPTERLSRDQALTRAGYGSLPPAEQGHPLFVYNRFGPVGLNNARRVANPLQPQPLNVTPITPAAQAPIYRGRGLLP